MPNSDHHDAGVFLVDDEKEFTELMSQLLEEGMGLHTRVFNDPTEALRAIDESVPRFVISDLVMPRMSGLDFLREVSIRRPEVPCLLLTGNLLPSDEIDARRSPSIVNVLSKPVSWRILADEIRKHTGPDVN